MACDHHNWRYKELLTWGGLYPWCPNCDQFQIPVAYRWMRESDASALPSDWKPAVLQADEPAFALRLFDLTLKGEVMALIKTFPQVIFVTVNEDGDNDYMLAALTKVEALNKENRAIVGTYQFVVAEEINAEWSAKRLRNRRTR